MPGSMVIAVMLHVPYVRRAGVWPFGETQLYGAIADAFVPTLDSLLALQAEGLSSRLTLALSPLLSEQLADPLIRRGFEDFMIRRIAAHESAAARHTGALADVARWHVQRDHRLLESWGIRHRRDLVRTVRELALDGAVEVVAMPASGAVLPLLGRPRAAALQVHMGLVASELHVEHRPVGMWLPGGAIAPRGALEPLAVPDHWKLAMYGDDTAELPGTDDVLRDHGLTYAFAGEHALHGGRPAPDEASPLDVHATERELALLTRHDGLFSAWFDPERGFASHSAYLGPSDASGDRLVRRPEPSSDGRLATGRGGDLELTVAPAPLSAPYDPGLAEQTARSQAIQAATTARALLDDHLERTGRQGVIVLPLDARLFQSWIEGPQWLCEFVRATRQAELGPISGAEAVHRFPPRPLEAVHPASWERGGDFRLWRAPNTTWYWEVVASILDTTDALVDRFVGASHSLIARGLAQVVREAFLLVESEWPAMVGTGGDGRDYAAERIRLHHDRFRRLAEMMGAGDFGENFDTALLERFEELDNPFELIDYERRRDTWAELFDDGAEV